jgi:hypothetical protein
MALPRGASGWEGKVRSLDELVDTNDPSIRLIRQWVEEAENDCTILPPSGDKDRVLLSAQVSTRSTLGALAYHTGGILVDSGWLRLLGSGHAKLPRNLADWNEGRSHGFYLVADDAAGGFFAVNGGAFGEQRDVYYWSPDDLDWQPLGLGFTDFFRWSLTSALADFYECLRWSTWLEDIADVAGDRCFSFDPYLWTKEGSIEGSDRRAVSVAEAFDMRVDVVRQLSQTNENLEVR